MLQKKILVEMYVPRLKKNYNLGMSIYSASLLHSQMTFFLKYFFLCRKFFLSAVHTDLLSLTL